jgi:hypothetical protein
VCRRFTCDSTAIGYLHYQHRPLHYRPKETFQSNIHQAMPRVNIFQLALLDHGPLHNITSLLYSLGIVWNAIVDVLLHILHSRPLPHIPPRLVGNTLLCSLCRAIFETHAIATYHLDHWKAYRHQDDIALLQLSANSGCQICTRLLVWIGSIENDPGWLKLSRLPWGFTIRSQLLKTEVHNQFEVLFTIFRFGPWYAKYEDMCYRLKLRIIPIEGKLIIFHTAANFSCLCLFIVTDAANRSRQS